MDIPKEGARYRAADGLVYVVEAVHDLTDDPDHQEGDSRYTVEIVEADSLNDMSAAGFDFLEAEFIDFYKAMKLTPI